MTTCKNCGLSEGRAKLKICRKDSHDFGEKPAEKCACPFNDDTAAEIGHLEGCPLALTDNRWKHEPAESGKCEQGNCPFYPNANTSWSGGPEFWENAKKRHEEHSEVRLFTRKEFEEAEAKARQDGRDSLLRELGVTQGFNMVEIKKIQAEAEQRATKEAAHWIEAHGVNTPTGKLSSAEIEAVCFAVKNKAQRFEKKIQGI